MSFNYKIVQFTAIYKTDQYTKTTHSTIKVRQTNGDDQCKSVHLTDIEGN